MFLVEQVVDLSISMDKFILKMNMFLAEVCWQIEEVYKALRASDIDTMNIVDIMLVPVIISQILVYLVYILFKNNNFLVSLSVGIEM